MYKLIDILIDKYTLSGVLWTYGMCLSKFCYIIRLIYWAGPFHRESVQTQRLISNCRRKLAT